MRLGHLAVVVFLTLGSGCPQPPETSDGGTSCQSAQDATNLLQNPGFECGASAEGWLTQFGEVTTETSVVHSGKQAARLFSPVARTSVSLWHEADVVKAPSGQTYCASVFVRGTAKIARITIRRVGSDINETFSSPVSDTEWTRVPPESYGGVSAKSLNDTSLLFRVWIPNAQAGDYLYIDDAHFWKSSDGKCLTP